jgi:hypothetical protein
MEDIGVDRWSNFNVTSHLRKRTGFSHGECDYLLAPAVKSKYGPTRPYFSQASPRCDENQIDTRKSLEYKPSPDIVARVCMVRLLHSGVVKGVQYAVAWRLGLPMQSTLGAPRVASRKAERRKNCMQVEALDGTQSGRAWMAPHSGVLTLRFRSLAMVHE